MASADYLIRIDGTLCRRESSRTIRQRAISSNIDLTVTKAVSGVMQRLSAASPHLEPASTLSLEDSHW